MNFDRAYGQFALLVDLAMRDGVWITRAKPDLQSRVARKNQHEVDAFMLHEDLIRLTGAPSVKACPVELCRLAARVEVDEALRKLVFLMNRLAWSAKRG